MTLLTVFAGPSAAAVSNPGPSTGPPLLQIVRDVCGVIGVVKPTTVFGGISANRTMEEMLDLANEMAQRISYDTRDWTRLRRQQVYTGDGVTTAFNLPADFKRMMLTANVWASSDTGAPMRFIADPDEWLQRRAANFFSGPGEWTMMGGQMLIEPAIPAGATVRFAYLERNCISLASGGFGDRFQSDADSFVLDARLLKLGMIWQWKAHKGSPYAEDMGTYGDALANDSGADQPAPILIGGVPMSGLDVRIAYPWALPTGYVT